MGIAFDDGAADALITAAYSADEVLRGEGGFLNGAVEQAVQDFNGGYGRLFKDACAIRSDERGKLSGVLAALAEDVGEASAGPSKRKPGKRTWKPGSNATTSANSTCSPGTSPKHPQQWPPWSWTRCPRAHRSLHRLFQRCFRPGTGPDSPPDEEPEPPRLTRASSAASPQCPGRPRTP